MTNTFRTSMLVCGLTLCAVLPARSAEQPAPTHFLIRNGDRVVFYGDSITDSEWYPTLVESYILTRFPTWRNHFSNRGVSGDNAGSIARFERDVIAQKPNFCTYNMGFNDGGYFSFSPAALEKWLANIEKSVGLARRADPELRAEDRARLEFWATYPECNTKAVAQLGRRKWRCAEFADIVSGRPTASPSRRPDG
jgi:hypothetical protein